MVFFLKYANPNIVYAKNNTLTVPYSCLTFVKPIIIYNLLGRTGAVPMKPKRATATTMLL